MAKIKSTCSPLVTIVTPSFNQGRFIRATIESVLNQDYPYIEYIVIDGCSTDDTINILKEYDNRIKWISEKDNGQTEAINKGWKMGNGQIIAWLNSDDTYLPGAISKAVDFICSNKELVMIYGEGWHVDEDGNIIERYPTESFNFKRLAETCFICQPTVFLRREVLEDVGFLDENLNYCMDYDYWIRIGKRNQIGYLKEYLANSRLHARTKTVSKRYEVQREVILTLQRHFGHVPSNWIYSFCDALLKKKLKIEKESSVKFCLLISVLFFLTYLRFNKKIPINELKKWFKWLKKKISGN